MRARLTGVQRRRRLVRRSFRLRFGSSSLARQAKGWRHFYDRRWRLVRRTGALSVRTWRPRSLIAREEERGVRGASPGHEPGDCGPRGKDGAIDPTSGKNTPASQEARTGFEPKPSGRAPALHALRVSHDACLFSLFPSVSPMRGGKRPLSVGRVESAFPPATNHYATLRLICKENSTNGFSQRWPGRLWR